MLPQDWRKQNVKNGESGQPSNIFFQQGKSALIQRFHCGFDCGLINAQFPKMFYLFHQYFYPVKLIFARSHSPKVAIVCFRLREHLCPKCICVIVNSNALSSRFLKRFRRFPVNFRCRKRVRSGFLSCNFVDRIFQ